MPREDSLVIKAFKNHPDYMKEKWIKPMFIGAKEATMKDGTTYKVI